LALILLLLATVLGVYKPFGMTPYGKRQHGERQASRRSPLEDRNRVRTPRWVYFAWIVVLSLVVLFIAAHLMGGRFRTH
jgi:hypothetical protein